MRRHIRLCLLFGAIMLAACASPIIEQQATSGVGASGYADPREAGHDRDPAISPTTVSPTILMPSAPPTMTAEDADKPSPTPVGLLYSDAFATTQDSRWWHWSGTDGMLEHHAGGYQIKVQTSEYLLWSYLKGYRKVRDATIEVNAVARADGGAGQYGIVCRAQPVDSFYVFFIGTDGFAQIGKYIRRNSAAERWIPLAQGYDEEIIGPPGSTNHIRADCVGTALTLYVNGQQLLSTTDTEFTKGQVGMLAFADTDASIDVLFDDFLLAEPRPAPPEGRAIGSIGDQGGDCFRAVTPIAKTTRSLVSTARACSVR